MVNLHQLKIFFSLALLGFMVVVRPVQSEGRYGREVLCLYKSSDGYTADSNLLKKFAHSYLLSKNLQPIYHDFDKTTWSDIRLDKVRAIITWFSGSLVDKKESGLEYIRFLHKAIDQNIKIIIIGSFGAYGYLENGKEKWDLIDQINSVFFRLGFKHDGFWTDKAEELKIISEDIRTLNPANKQDARRSSYFQMITPVRPDVQSLIKLQRSFFLSGVQRLESSAALIGQSGGFILERYDIYNGKPLFRIEPFLGQIFFPGTTTQKFLFVYDENVAGIQDILKNVKITFSYAKINSDFISIQKTSHLVVDDLLPFHALLFVLRNDSLWGTAPFQEAINRGQTGIFLHPLSSVTESMAKFLGITKIGKELATTETGIQFETPFFVDDLALHITELGLTYMPVTLHPSVKWIASTKDKQRQKIPLAWEQKAGKGKVHFWNMDSISRSKIFRGTLIQTLHRGGQNLVSGLANVAMFMLDDFPQPLWNIHKQDKLKILRQQLLQAKDESQKKNILNWIANLSNYPEITDTEFSRDLFLPGLEKLQQRYHLRFSAFLVFNYNDNIGEKGKFLPVRDFYLAKNNVPVHLTQAVLQKNWELGFHGYNHMSLSMTPPVEIQYTPWQDIDSMVRGLRMAETEWRILFGDHTLPVSYVAPNNIIDKNGLIALHQGMPSIRTISAVYIKGGPDETDTEFEWSPGRNFYFIPRPTSGFFLNDLSRYVLHDVVHNFGVVSHFIHPDDYFDPVRSNGFAGWSAMLASIQKDFDLLRSAYPWLRWMTVKDAYFAFLFYDALRLTVTRERNHVDVHSSGGTQVDYFFRIALNPGQRIVSAQGCGIIHLYKNHRDAVVKANSNHCRLTMNR